MYLANLKEFNLKFTEFGFEESLIDSISSMGFEDATPIQENAIPLIMKGKDMIACAQTGTGKTAAFVLPVLNHLIQNPSEHITALIIVPTRELALQTDQSIQGLAYFSGISSIPVFGGGDGIVFSNEKKALVQGVNILIATPGRLLSHLNMGYVPLDHLKFLILDEADRMLDMGFHDDIMRIVSHLPQNRQSLLFSATMPDKIRKLSRKLLQNPEEISLSISKPAERVEQSIYYIEDKGKIPLIEQILDIEQVQSTVIFVGTKIAARQLERSLKNRKLKVSAIHSDLTQEERETSLLSFRSRRTSILVATDILSRGIDIDDIGLVINYDVPHDAEDYVHRVGRTARAESKGKAMTFVNKESVRKFKRIEDFIGSGIAIGELPESIKSLGFDVGEMDFEKKQGPKNFKGKGHNKNYRGKKPFNKKSKPPGAQ